MEFTSGLIWINMDCTTSYICIIIVSEYFASGLIWINVIRCYNISKTTIGLI